MRLGVRGASLAMLGGALLAVACSRPASHPSSPASASVAPKALSHAVPDAGEPREEAHDDFDQAILARAQESYLPNVVSKSLTLRRRKRTIVFNVQNTGLIATRHLSTEESRGIDTFTKLVPLACVLDGKFEVGGACMAGMPARARVRFSDGTMHTTEKLARGGPACEADEFERGRTDGWLLPRMDVEGAMLAFWPDDADVGLVVHGSQRFLLPDADRLAAKVNEHAASELERAYVMQAFDESLDGSGVTTRVISLSSLGPQPSSRAEVALLRGGQSWFIHSDRPALFLPVVATIDVAGDGKRLLVIHTEQPDGIVALVDDHGQMLYGYACASW